MVQEATHGRAAAEEGEGEHVTLNEMKIQGFLGTRIQWELAHGRSTDFWLEKSRNR